MLWLLLVYFPLQQSLFLSNYTPNAKVTSTSTTSTNSFLIKSCTHSSIRSFSMFETCSHKDDWNQSMDILPHEKMACVTVSSAFIHLEPNGHMGRHKKLYFLEEYLPFKPCSIPCLLFPIDTHSLQASCGPYF